MTRIKLCGLSRENDIAAVNELMPEYVGFVFWEKSRRYVSPETAETLRKMLAPEILSVGVFADEAPDEIASIVQRGVIDIIQLHGHEHDEYISALRTLTGATPIIKAFTINSHHDIDAANASTADYIMLDSGKGTGRVFCWEKLQGISRPYFLAGGLTPENVGYAVNELKPFAVDVSSGIETGSVKDRAKMTAFVAAVRKEKL